MLLNIIMWYFIAGIAWGIVSTIGIFIVLRIHFKLDVMNEGLKRVKEKYLYHWHTKIGEILGTINGILVWPKRTTEFPERMNMLWEECEMVAIERKFREEGL